MSLNSHLVFPVRALLDSSGLAASIKSLTAVAYLIEENSGTAYAKIPKAQAAIMFQALQLAISARALVQEFQDAYIAPNSQ